jgi:CheY-like chemotaxis protein
LLGEVFKPFFSTKPDGQGSGLGLSMVDGFVKQSGGHVGIESALDRGTTVRIYLPRVAAREVPVIPDSAAEIPRGGETILVVEDDEAVRAVAAETIRSLGYTVLQAANPSAALETLRTGAQIDVLFTDVVMPGPIRSSELAREARRLRPAIAVLFTSGYPDDVIGQDGRLDEGVQLLNKPHTGEALARKLRDVLAASSNGSNGHPPARSVAETQATRAGLTVLLVEDDEIIRLVSGEILRDLGHQVAEAASGEDAISALVATPADVLITDIRLPGIAGDTLAAFARHLKPNMGVVFASGDVIAAPSFGGPPPYVLRKPYDAWDLATAVAAVAPAGRAG